MWIGLGVAARRVVNHLQNIMPDVPPPAKVSGGPLVKTAHRMLELALAIEEMEYRDLVIPVSVTDEAVCLAMTLDMLLRGNSNGKT